MFRGAVRGDLPQILKIYAHARAVMKASGNPTQWGDNFPPQELLEEDIDSNRLFLYVVNGQIEAVFAFILGADPTYAAIEDGQWLDDTLPYGTVHRLASAGKHKGVASAVLDWSMEHCQSLRADTHADNQIMQHLLEKNGFTRCGIIHVADGTPRIAYQKLALTQQRLSQAGEELDKLVGVRTRQIQRQLRQVEGLREPDEDGGEDPAAPFSAAQRPPLT